MGGDPSAALLEFRQALRLRPDYWESYNGIGIAYDRLNNVAAAADAFNHALELNPSNEFIAKNLAAAKAKLRSHHK